MEIDKVYLGNAIEVLKQMDSESVDCLVTSPPYYSMRTYDTIISVKKKTSEEATAALEEAKKQYETDYPVYKYYVSPIKEIKESEGKESINRLLPAEEVETESKENISTFYTGTVKADLSYVWGGDPAHQHSFDENGYCVCKAWKGTLGNEPTYQGYVEHLCLIMDEAKRVLKKTGTMWVNIGDTYSGSMNWTEEWQVGVIPSQWKPEESLQRGSDLPDQCLLQVPSRFAIEMTRRGWSLRNSIIWNKPNPMPNSVKRRYSNAYEMIYFFVKSPKDYYFKQQFEEKYYPNAKVADYCKQIYTEAKKARNLKLTGAYDGKQTGEKIQGASLQTFLVAIRTVGREFIKNHPELIRTERDFIEDFIQEQTGYPEGRNQRDIWTIKTQPDEHKHYAQFPYALVENCLKAGCPEGGLVIDPFFGSGTTGVVAKRMGMRYAGIDVSPAYVEMAKKRLGNVRSLENYVEK